MGAIHAIILKNSAIHGINSAEYRIVYYDGNIVRFSYKDYAEGGKISDITMKVHTFIGRLIRHFPMIRYAGLFARRWKKQYVSRCRIALNQPEPDDTDANTHQYRSYAVLTSIPIFQCSNIPGSFDNPEAL